MELSSAEGSIAFVEDDEERFVAMFPNDRKHSGPFFENLQRCLEDAGPPEQIVVGLGPGSYAGTRIAIATATGLQAAMGSELMGLPSLCALPAATGDYVVIGDARRQSFWYAQVAGRRCIEGPTLCTRPELADRLAGAPSPIFASEPLLAFPNVPVLYPSARILARSAPASADVRRAPLEPLYLREPHITQAKAAQK
ncbi:MAG TPA: tRNA (adenosine(37)-N6)-threonylcarbamoyltransferase complex dimerization subunit type 1 TsaB [Chthoniobacterales bacterium]|nr:tRNA (adenosine(37)-N6)-threonylcarbamoyltransferase complex dimerization subunit type 1 TsaB [Chthoniobacterales bacterium]